MSKSNIKFNLIFFISNFSLITIIQFFTILPWWTFLCTSGIMGLFFTFSRINIESFGLGFFSGFLNWFFIGLIFHNIYDGNILHKITQIFHINILLYFLFSGLLGGLLNGLACFAGYNIMIKEPLSPFD